MKKKTPPEQPPRLANRRDNQKSSFKLGRTIGGKREKLETANEREVARKKDKRKHRLRVISSTIIFIILVGILVALAFIFVHKEVVPNPDVESSELVVKYEPTIEIVDASASATGGKISSRMAEYIGMLESDLKSYGYQPIRAVIPVDSIREVDIYLDKYPGYLKTTIDRGSGVTAEDADRMLRYLEGQGITSFEYIDIRIDGRAFWK